MVFGLGLLVVIGLGLLVVAGRGRGRRVVLGRLVVVLLVVVVVLMVVVVVVVVLLVVLGLSVTKEKKFLLLGVVRRVVNGRRVGRLEMEARKRQYL